MIDEEQVRQAYSIIARYRVQKRQIVKKYCPVCGVQFMATRTRIYCSPACRQKAYSNKQAQANKKDDVICTLREFYEKGHETDDPVTRRIWQEMMRKQDEEAMREIENDG